MPTAAEQIAQEILDLINRSPRTPTKAQLVDTITVMLDVAAEDTVTVPPGTSVGLLRPGAFLRIEPNMSLTIDGWQINSPRPLTIQEGALAILQWIKQGVLAMPKQ